MIFGFSVDPSALIEGAIDKTRKIIWLKEHAYTLQETIAFLRKILTKEEFIHCVMQERQPYYIYRRDNTPNPYHFPNVQTLMNNGFKLTNEDLEFFRRYKIYVD